MRHSALDLPWLPSAPKDFAAACRRLDPAAPTAGAELQRLAGHRLDAGQSLHLRRAIARVLREGGPPDPLAPMRLGVLASATFDMVADMLPAAAARHGVALELTLGPFDQVVQQALDPASEVHAAGCDAVLVAVDARWLGLDRPDFEADEASRVAASLTRLGSIVEGLRAQGRAGVILSTLAVPPSPLFGSLDRAVAGTPRSAIERANRLIVELARDTGSQLLDVAALAERIGTEAWFDPVQWGAYKFPFAADCNAIYADTLGRLLGALRGKARKCLVLDLDNTLWGGAVGDEGVAGLVLGQGSAGGEAFLAVQALALDLRERGVILAVSSKNDDAVARAPFSEHPEMLLRLEHLSVFQANWLPKADNLAAIARTLNIGLDALVLLDDNPAERERTRAALPMVAIPELPADPSWFPWTLAAAGYFEAVAFSDEDRLRVASYAGNAERARVESTSTDLGDYLASLGMELWAGPFDARARARIAQLINKTNQFNLTTRRTTEAEVAALEAGEGVHTFQVRLADRFGDLGMIGVLIAREAGAGDWLIESWLMSCRVLGRKVEEAMLLALVRRAEAAGGRRLLGTYLPTAKNGMVERHFDRLGFEVTGVEADGSRHYALDVAAYRGGALPHRITGFDPWPGPEVAADRAAGP